MILMASSVFSTSVHYAKYEELKLFEIRSILKLNLII